MPLCLDNEWVRKKSSELQLTLQQGYEADGEPAYRSTRGPYSSSPGRGEQSDQQNRDRRKECKEIAEKAWVTIELLSHQPHGWSDHEEEGEGEQDKRDRDLKIQDLASLTVDFVALILLP